MPGFDSLGSRLKAAEPALSTNKTRVVVLTSSSTADEVAKGERKIAEVSGQGGDVVVVRLNFGATTAPPRPLNPE